MKNFKRILAVALSLMIILSCAVVASAAESKTATGSQSFIYFNSGDWKNVNQVFCHIWERGGAAFFDWQAKGEKCEGSGNEWAYDVSGILLESDKDYCVIFSDDNGMQTCDVTLGAECIGDTLKITGKHIENPVDSEKRADEAVWTKNSSKYGPHLSITSIGNIVGSKLCPREKGYEVIGDWLPVYYNSPYVSPVEALANAFPKFGIKTEKDITDIYNYIVKKQTGEDEKAIKKILDEAFKKAYTKRSNTMKVSVTNKSFKAKALKKKAASYSAVKVTKAQGKVTYSVTKKNSKLTFKNGKITVKKKTKKGTYKITVKITASGNSSYKSATVTRTISVRVK